MVPGSGWGYISISKVGVALFAPMPFYEFNYETPIKFRRILMCCSSYIIRTEYIRVLVFLGANLHEFTVL
jgi:hypothetical protein